MRVLQLQVQRAGKLWVRTYRKASKPTQLEFRSHVEVCVKIYAKHYITTSILNPRKNIYTYTNAHISPPFSPLDTTHCFVLSLYKYLFMHNYSKSCPTLKQFLKTQNTFKYSIIQVIKTKRSTKTQQKARKKSSPTPFLNFKENKSNIKTSSSQCLESTLWCFNVWYIFSFPLICHAITFFA